jgi:hypothetical protein
MKKLDVDAELRGVFADALVIFGQSHRSKDLGLDLAAHIHAGTMDDQNFRHRILAIGLRRMLVDDPIH